MTPLPVIDARPLIADVDAALVPLLRSLTPEDWRRPAVGRWSVRDVAAHLLDGALRRVSFGRDGHVPPPPAAPIRGFDDLVAFLDTLNADWVRASARLSTRVLCDLSASAATELTGYVNDVDLDAPALFAVDWAGQDGAFMWMDIAREYTERFHHQQQIRDAVGAPTLASAELIHPLLETLLRAVPRAYRAVSASEGDVVAITATGDGGGRWAVVRDRESWRLHRMTAKSGRRERGTRRRSRVAVPDERTDRRRGAGQADNRGRSSDCRSVLSFSRGHGVRSPGDRVEVR